MAKLVDVWIFDWDKYSPDDLVQKDDSFIRASTPPGPHEKRPRYHLRCSRSAASAAIRIKPIRPSVTATSSSANAVPDHLGSSPLTALAAGNIRSTALSHSFSAGSFSPARCSVASFTKAAGRESFSGFR
jgi:hypothetical protein